jgi:hypothetical protein
MAHGAAMAQVRHEFGMAAAGGKSWLNYNLYDNDYAHLLRGYGGEAAINYTIFFNANWAIGTGAAFAMYNSTAALSGSEIRSIVKPFPLDDTKSYYLKTDLYQYEEKQRMFTLNVPLFVQFETNDKHRFYARIGGKLALPMLIPATYEVKNGKFTNTPVCECAPDAQNCDCANNFNPASAPDTFGWKSYVISHNGSINLKMGVMLSAEIGTKWRLTRTNSLYTGIYVDYGAFLDMHAPDRKSLVEDNVSDAKNHFTIGSIVHSENGTGNDILQGAPLTKMVTPFAVGIVLRLALGFVKIPPTRPRPDIVDTLVLYDTIFRPVHDTITITKTETFYRDLTTSEGNGAASRGLLVRRDTVYIYRDHYIYRSDTIASAAAATQNTADTMRVIKYKHNYIISNYLPSATFVTAEKKATLDHVISMMLSHPKASVIVEGHTCNYGNDNINQLLGLRRAQTVATYLIQHGVSSSRIKIVSKGDSEPIVLNDGEYNRSKNRRVKLIIVDSTSSGY